MERGRSAGPVALFAVRLLHFYQNNSRFGRNELYFFLRIRILDRLDGLIWVGGGGQCQVCAVRRYQ